MHIIKRYSNRKLYDTVAKSYITLENIEIMVKEGEEIQIVDNESGSDITAGVLSQIIAERTRKDKSYASGLFVQMIRKGSGTMYGYARKIVQTVSETAYSVEEEIETKVKRLVSSGEITSEEGDQLSEDIRKHRIAYMDKIEKRVEKVSNLLLRKLNIPTVKQMDALQNALDRLEQKIEAIEKLPQEQQQPLQQQPLQQQPLQQQPSQQQ